MKALGYIGAFLGGALAGGALGLILLLRKVKILATRFLAQLMISARSMTSS